MDQESPSGIYKCTKCKNIIAHIKGYEFIPCSKCNKESWEMIKRDD